MIFEYAVEPELAATWHEHREGRYFKEKFGLEQGRLLSRYPKDWKRLVWEALDTTDQNARKRMEVLLGFLCETSIRRTAQGYDPHRSWLENAEAEHARCAFHAILARSHLRKAEHLLNATTLDEDSESRWRVPPGMPVTREPNRLAAAIGPMLRCASEIIFVDPHFRPDKERFVRPLEAFLRAAFTDRPGAPLKRLEVQAGEDLGAAEFKRQCQNLLANLIPRGVKVRFGCWQRKEGGERFHDRYVLTNIGGVGFGIGLDDAAHEPGQTAKLHRLDRETYTLLWGQHAGPRPEFKLLEGGLVDVVGTKEY